MFQLLQIFSLFSLVLGILILYVGAFFSLFGNFSLVVAALILLVYGITNLVFAIILLIGAQQRSISKCRVWLIIQSLILVFLVLMTLFGGDVVGPILASLFVAGKNVCFMSIVFAFWKELKRKKADGGLQSDEILTTTEINEFKNGIGLENMIDDTEQALLQLQPYNVEYELQKSSIKIDGSKILGKGSFGVVFKGSLVNHECADDVAIKTTGVQATPLSIKMMLSEIKIMIHVGKHSNIVSIIGACTADAHLGKVFLVVELCENGSLETYLRTLFDLNKCNPSHKHVNEDAGALPTDVKVKLITWAFQIASGMEHISYKKITHADLATRNVLLTTELGAKITDFGLSRHLYNYKNYVKFNDSDPLPWRWMALESINFLKFSTQSDVWAYGVTLWEIFSFGRTPYPGMSWSTCFVTELEAGIRLQKPGHANAIIYETMLKCWLTDTSERPSFTQLRKFFKDLLYKNSSTVYTTLNEYYEEGVTA